MNSLKWHLTKDLKMMQIQYASDLHIEMMANRAWLFGHGLQPAGNILVLAGDIIYLGNRQLIHNEYFDWLADNYEQVYIVPGNHEYYGGYELRDTLTDFEMQIRPNVKYINNKSVIIGNTELFFTTLWSRVPNAFIADIQNGMMDTRLICYKNALLYAGEFNELHSICLNWMDGAMKASTAKHKVVVTHHCPTTNKVFDNHPGSKISCGFMTDDESFIINHDAEYWIFGHTHFNSTGSTVNGGLQIGNTLLLTNQLGYIGYGEDKGFNQAKTIEIDDD